MGIIVQSDVLLTFKTNNTPFEYKYYTFPFGCSSHGTCNKYNGLCDYNMGTYGNQCQFIESPLNCYSPNGVCDGKTFICKCNNSYTGEGCDLIIKYTHTQDCICDTQTKGLSCEESRLLIESVESTNLDGGTTTIFGYFGRTIKIGDSQCTNIKVFNETPLNCFIGPGEGTHNVTITDDDLSYSAINMFQYIEEKIKISKISGGAIIGITVGCVVGLSVLGVCCFYRYRRNKKIELFM
ncbi:hypothetical protein ACTFIZ_010082 [Dictyostelium cf. discoideum]